MKTFRTLLKIELKLSFRGMDMIIFAIIMPLVVFVILGMMYGQKPAFPGSSITFLEQSFGAISTISICAGGLMGLPLVISDYRSKRILKRFQVTPVRPSVLLLVQLCIYIIYSIVSLLILFITAYLFFDFHLGIKRLAFFLGGWILVMITMFSIGVLVGGLAKDSKTAGIIASLLYFPMLIFSGATLPFEVMPPFMQKIAAALPLSQGIKLLKFTITGATIHDTFFSICAMLILTICCMTIAIRHFRWE